ncbi:helix-turn-helix domain-containing protein [Bradyrhizobium diazoefficiens]|jgi:AraC family ethanolamine operon transcriptional activator|uniref:Putative transcriptional regulatory protein n=1 Tax=Bradyrhizobium diazoefficiens SEMIA 5080 TaxID=754504 RepID=A0A837CL80_9BRAD|nr:MULTISPECIES: helix-turn-helix domain-containing protein [Bradyrhizobium]APO53740.1 transcriptional regulator [Bradyrhizobium diazoefficiens]KGJ69745.1 putative transcriptional regulatory protein [Bradyrhizobium diazoefficiens SEMIA 5080]KOY10746.1 transcriptional regulator [Bradyrhizobium diazoefficiens]MCD9296996.1 helix-turn-helix domain-containing protein [Bradyrhizobium diazoefficiens]MCD9810014.1 helix-turn-helix domain-containing protein [Bradyrhizobium diazoefficiens]
MTSDDDAPTLAPKIFRFSDVDEFRNAIRGLNFEFTPFVRRIAAEQIILQLPGCDVNVTRAFPRVVDAELIADCTAVGFAMDDLDVPIRFNGAQRDRAVVVIGSGGAAYNTIEEVQRQIASVVFRPEVKNRGWPETRSNFKIFEASTLALNGLRNVVREVVAAASEPIDPTEAPLKAAAMKESLFGAVDAVFANLVSARWTVRPNDERQFKIFQDIRALLSGDLAQPIYSEEIARELGLSVRTLHDVVRRYRGMSLHRYLRLRRLWLVRLRLLAGADSVKAVALAFGFWHLSDFSRSYRDRFGEAPSETLERGRRR